MIYHKRFNNLNDFLINNHSLFIDINNNINDYCYISLLIRYSIFINKPFKTFEELLKVKDDYLIILFNEFSKIDNIQFDINKIIKINLNTSNFKNLFDNINYIIK
jgi:hypothetical protein